MDEKGFFGTISMNPANWVLEEPEPTLSSTEEFLRMVRQFRRDFERVGIAASAVDIEKRTVLGLDLFDEVSRKKLFARRPSEKQVRKAKKSWSYIFSD